MKNTLKEKRKSFGAQITLMNIGQQTICLLSFCLFLCFLRSLEFGFSNLIEVFSIFVVTLFSKFHHWNVFVNNIETVGEYLIRKSLIGYNWNKCILALHFHRIESVRLVNVFNVIHLGFTKNTMNYFIRNVLAIISHFIYCKYLAQNHSV